MTTDPIATGNIGQWAPDSWSWIMAQMPDRMCPEEMDHMNYLGPCPQPKG